MYSFAWGPSPAIFPMTLCPSMLWRLMRTSAVTLLVHAARIGASFAFKSFSSSATESPLAWSRDSGAEPGTPPNLTHPAGTRVCRHLYGRQNALGEVIFGGDRHSIGYDASVDDVKEAEGLEDMVLIHNSRLSIQPVKKDEWDIVTKLGGRKRS